MLIRKDRQIIVSIKKTFANIVVQTRNTKQFKYKKNKLNFIVTRLVIHILM